MTTSHLPLRLGVEGPAVLDLSTRLVALGMLDRPKRVFDDVLGAALVTFQQSRRLHCSGECDHITWSSLVEAGFNLGDRLVYLTSPMMRGDDVAELQLRLGGLGFDTGRVDGIFGPITERAVADFQQNAGLVTDKVCGPETVAMLARLRHRGGTATVAGVRERDSLRHRAVDLSGSRVALVHQGQAAQLVGMLGADLRRRGAEVAVLSGDDWSGLAAEVNEFGAETCIAIEVVDSVVCEAAFFETTGFSSFGGQHLAAIILDELPATPNWPLGTIAGMSLPILRETKPPTAAVRLGPALEISDQCALIASALARAVLRWNEEVSTIDLAGSTLPV